MKRTRLIDEYDALVALQQIRSQAERLREILLSPELASLRARLGPANINVDLSQVLNITQAYGDEVTAHLDENYGARW